MTRIAVLMACFNRRERTLACLMTLKNQTELSATVAIYLVDDGCTDGTGEAVSAFDNVRVLKGDGTLFWTRGMHLAFATAMEEDFDGYLWLNDDVKLDQDALARLLATFTRLKARAPREKVIVVGSTRDPDSGKVTYGGVRRLSHGRPLTFVRIEPGADDTTADTFEGNFVYLPRETARLVGNLDPIFLCAGGDTDYGLRARKAGVQIWVMPGTIGTCPSNPVSQSWRAPGVGFRERWARVKHPARGLPWKYWSRFARRHGGAFWFMHACLAYRPLLWPTARPPVRENAPAGNAYPDRGSSA
jgi:GT2 family glycosyltransferase